MGRFRLECLVPILTSKHRQNSKSACERRRARGGVPVITGLQFLAYMCDIDSGRRPTRSQKHLWQKDNENIVSSGRGHWELYSTVDAWFFLRPTCRKQAGNQN